VTCLPGAETVSRCTQCNFGYYITPGTSVTSDTCTTCSGTIGNCATPDITCISSSVLRCRACNVGYYLTPGTTSTSDTCTMCGSIGSCLQQTCVSGSSPKRCVYCNGANTFRLYGGSTMDDTCPTSSACPTINNCVTVTCAAKSASPYMISRCTACAAGYYRTPAAQLILIRVMLVRLSRAAPRQTPSVPCRVYRNALSVTLALFSSRVHLA